MLEIWIAMVLAGELCLHGEEVVKPAVAQSSSFNEARETVTTPDLSEPAEFIVQKIAAVPSMKGAPQSPEKSASISFPDCLKLLMKITSASAFPLLGYGKSPRD
jgi:hypothetical protein